MSKFAQQGHKTTAIRPAARTGRACAVAGGLVLALPLVLGQVPAAQAQSRSGIVINNDVLESLGPGPRALVPAPLAPAAPPTPLSPRDELNYQTPAAAPAEQGSGDSSFQTYGSGNHVVTRPGTLLFPPLEAPTSTLAPSFQDNDAARAEAMSSAFAAGPEPTSQLLIPLEGEASGNDSIVIYMENLPAADPNAVPGSAPQLTLQRPPLATPEPAPRKPQVPAGMLAEVGATSIDDTNSGLAPEFQMTEPEAATADEAPRMAGAEVTAPPETATAEPPARQKQPAAMPAGPREDATAKGMRPAEPEAAPVSQAAEAAAGAARQSRAPESSAGTEAPTSLAEVPEAKSSQTPADAPVSLLPEDGAGDSVQVTQNAPAPASDMGAIPGVQSASLTVGNAGDMSFLFDGNSAELSNRAQADLRSLAASMRDGENGRIQVLGFASAQGGSQDMARKLALSRALKVRTFLIDAGIASARIQVRTLGDKTDGGPANRVDIRPIDS